METTLQLTEKFQQYRSLLSGPGSLLAVRRGKRKKGPESHTSARITVPSKVFPAHASSTQSTTTTSISIYSHGPFGRPNRCSLLLVAGVDV
jgi:hypothetical protein